MALLVRSPTVVGRMKSLWCRHGEVMNPILRLLPGWWWTAMNLMRRRLAFAEIASVQFTPDSTTIVPSSAPSTLVLFVVALPLGDALLLIIGKIHFLGVHNLFVIKIGRVATASTLTINGVRVEEERSLVVTASIQRHGEVHRQ